MPTRTSSTACRSPSKSDPPRGIGAEIRRNSWFRPKKWSRLRDGVKRKSERKFYPGYVLVQMEMDEDTWHLVRDVPKVLGFIGGTPEKPAPITDKEAMQILRRVEEGVDKPRPKVLFRAGRGGPRRRWTVQRFQTAS